MGRSLASSSDSFWRALPFFYVHHHGSLCGSSVASWFVALVRAHLRLLLGSASCLPWKLPFGARQIDDSQKILWLKAFHRHGETALALAVGCF